MPSALYFPHTTIRSPALLRTGLLLWDELHTIVPSESWTPHQPYAGWSAPEQRLFERAAELIVRPRAPEPAEREAAHSAITALVATTPPRRFFDGPADPLALAKGSDLLVYEPKFSYATWHLLRRAGLVRSASSGAFSLPPAVALFAMAALATACAGAQLRLVTDRTAAYAWLAKWEAGIAGADLGQRSSRAPVAEYDRLVALSLRGIDASRIRLERLLALREDEVRHRGGVLREMRHRYATAVDTCVERLRTQVQTRHDRRIVLAEFEEEVLRDVKALRRELRLENVKLLLSKEVIVTAVATAGTFVPQLANVTGTIPSLIATGAGVFALGGAAAALRSVAEHKAARTRLLASHPYAFLYTAAKQR